MNCGECGFEVAQDFAFCPKCGAKVDRTCPGCGFACEPGFAFCPKCGGALAGEAAKTPPPAPKAEARGEATEADRRPVTVLFADLSGFTALGETLDPEDIRALQNDLHREMAEVIKDYDGFLEKFVGDAVLAIFGAPVAHEDDPERALRAALAMRQRIDGLSGRWKGRLGRALSLHVGVNTGAVVAGTLGTGQGTAYAVTGDTVNTASRLQSAAGAGEILVGPTTYQLTQHLFAFAPAGALEMKGKGEPVEAHRLEGAREQVGAFRGLAVHGLSSPLVGRQHELRQLFDAFEQSLRGRAQVVRVVGEAGSGKSRLAEECLAGLERDGRLEGVAVRRAACSSLGEQTYGVLANLVREGYAIEPGHTLDDARARLADGLRGLGVSEDETAVMVPYLSHVLGIGAGADAFADLEPEQLKRQIFMAARSLFEHRLRSGPVLLVVEDLHWADAASVELLRFLVDRLDDQRLLLLLTHRPIFDASQLATSRTSQTAIRLSPLSENDCQAMISGLFGSSAVQITRQLRQFVVERASGNPFYLEEIVRSLIDSGIIRRVGDGWECSDAVAILDVPLTIQGLLLSRLDRLPAEVRRVTQEAAVLGVEFNGSMLRAVSSHPELVYAALETLRESELVEEVMRLQAAPGATPGDTHFRFTHAIVQEVVYQNLLVRRRSELHGRAGEALEAACRGRPKRLEDLEALARHFTLGEDKVRGVSYLVEAGDWARRAYANEDAVKHYRRALEIIDEGEAGAERRLGLLEQLADLLGPLGRRDEALAHYESVLGALAEADDLAAQARLYRKIAGLHWESGSRGLAFARIRAALGLLEGREGDIELAHLYHEMGRLAFRSGDNNEAVAWAQKALDQAMPLIRGGNGETVEALASEAATVVSEAYNTMGVAAARLGRSEEAVGHVEKSLEVAEAYGLHKVACRGYTNLSVLYSELDPGRAIETCERGLDVAKKIGDFGFQSRLYANLGVSYCTFTGRCEGDGVDAVRRAIDLDRQLGLADHLPVSLVVLGQIYQCHGQPQMAIDLYREALSLAEELDEPQILFPCYDGLATVHLDIDDTDGAERYMEKAQAVCERAGLEPESLVVLPFLC